MFYRCKASPKHGYNIIEMDYGGGGHHKRLKDQTINCCVSRVPLPPYIKEQGGGCGRPGGGGTPPFLPPSLSFPLLSYSNMEKGGVLLPVGVGLLLGRLSLRPAEPPLHLYIRGQGGTSRHTIDY